MRERIASERRAAWYLRWLVCIVVGTCRSGASAQPHHHASKATAALSLALHLAERAASGKAGMHSQGCSAPSIAQMQGSKGGNPPMHILLLSGESSLKV